MEAKTEKGHVEWGKTIIRIILATLIIVAICLPLYYIFFHSPSSPKEVITGRIMSGDKPIEGAEVELYIGKDKNIDFVTTDKNGKFRFDWKNTDVKFESKQDNIVITKIGRDKWRLTISDETLTSWINNNWIFLGPIFGFFAGSLYGLFFQTLTNAAKRWKFRKIDYYPTLNDIYYAFNDIKSFFLRDQSGDRFTGDIVKHSEKKFRRIGDEIKQIIEYNQGLKEYDNKSFRKLKTYHQNILILDAFLADPERKHHQFFKEYFNDPMNAEKINSELKSSLDYLAEARLRSNVVLKIIKKLTLLLLKK